MWHGMLFARWTANSWFRYIVIREHETRDVNWDLHLGFPFELFGCILNIAQSSFANYMLCQSAKIMKLLLLSLLFLVRLVWKMPSLLSAIFFLAIYWLSQNQRKYFRKVWVWICHWDPSSLSLTTTEFMPVEFCLTLHRANSLHILDVLFFRSNSGLYALSCREFRFAVFQKPRTKIIIQLRSISCKVVLCSLSKSD